MTMTIPNMEGHYVEPKRPGRKSRLARWLSAPPISCFFGVFVFFCGDDTAYGAFTLTDFVLDSVTNNMFILSFLDVCTQIISLTK